MNNQFRTHFPFFQQHSDWAYLDSAATTLKPQILLDATTEFYQSAGSVHRSQYDQAQSEAYEQARNLVAKRFNLPTQGVVWTSGTTHSLNLVAYGLEEQLQAGDEIVISIAEHHANFIPWQQLAKRTGAVLHVVPVNEQFLVDELLFTQALNQRTKIVALNAVSNVTGVRQNVEQLIALTRQLALQANIVLDLAQAVLHEQMDCTQLGADFYAFSAHKLYGPTGVGVLMGKPEKLASLNPLFFGGKMLQDVDKDFLTLADLPYRLEAGTPNIAGIIGFGAVLSWLNQWDFALLNTQTDKLAQTVRKHLENVPNLQIFDNPKAISHTLSFSMVGVHYADLASVLTESKVAIRAGSHCAKPYLRFLNEQGTLRLSLAHYNNEADIEQFFNALEWGVDLLC